MLNMSRSTVLRAIGRVRPAAPAVAIGALLAAALLLAGQAGPGRPAALALFSFAVSARAGKL